MNTSLQNSTPSPLPYRLAALRLAAIVVTVMIIASAGARAVAAAPTVPNEPPRPEPVIVIDDLDQQRGGDEPVGSGRPGRPGRGPGQSTGGGRRGGRDDLGASSTPEAVQPIMSAEIDSIVAEAKASPQFVAEVTADRLAASGLETLSVRPGVQIDTHRLVTSTALDTHGELFPMFDRSNAELFATPPRYEEPIIVLENELLIYRRVTFELAPGACRANRPVLDEVCFSIDPTAPIPAEVAGGLHETRRRLAMSRDDVAIAHGVSVADAKMMTDTDLLDLMLNAGPRSIRRLSIVPIVDDIGRVGVVGTYQAPERLAPSADPVAHVAIDAGDPLQFDTRYFLTGNTESRRYHDKWSFEKDAWWHPRIYLGFAYLFEVGYGVRAPFAVDVDYVSGGVGKTTVAIDVHPVSLDVAAPRVGLPDDEFHDGDEFVLFVNVDCVLSASLAGIGGSLDCDDLYSIDTSFSRDFDPVIGAEHRRIVDWWLWDDEQSPLRFEVAGGAAWAELDLGVAADVENGRFGIEIDPLPNTTLPGVSDGLTWFPDRRSQPLVVDRERLTGGSGFVVSDPHHAFDISVRPEVKFTAGVDVKVYSNDWSFVWPLDFLGFSMGFDLDHHPQTVDSHTFALNWGFENPFEVDDWEMAPVEHSSGGGVDSRGGGAVGVDNTGAGDFEWNVGPTLVAGPSTVRFATAPFGEERSHRSRLRLERNQP